MNMQKKFIYKYKYEYIYKYIVRCAVYSIVSARVIGLEQENTFYSLEIIIIIIIIIIINIIFYYRYRWYRDIVSLFV